MTDKTKRQGFASMSKERHKSVSSLGGKNNDPEKRKFALDPEWAAQCARKRWAKERDKK